MREKIFEWVEITLGVTLLAIGFYFFLSATNLVTGGVTGLSVLLRPFKLMSDSVFILLMNIIALLVGWWVLGKSFFYKTFYATLLYPGLIFIFEIVFPNAEVIINQIDPNYQLLITAIFGGIFVGVGMGLVIRNNSTTGGMDVFQRILSIKLHIPFSVALYLIDGIIVLLGATIAFQNVFFAIISIFITGFLIEKVAVMGRTSYTVFIVTKEADKIRNNIIEKLDRGLTKISVKGGYKDEDRTMIICTLYRQQLYILKKLIDESDRKAFTIIVKTNEVIGEGFWKGV